MVDRKASQESLANSLDGTEFFAGVQDGHDVKITPTQIGAYLYSTGTIVAGNSNVTVNYNVTTGKLEISSTGGSGGGGSGSVTSVGILGGTGVTVTGISPITSTGTLTVSLANSGVTAGPYTLPNITVDAFGRITAASNGTLPVVGTVAPGNYTTANITVDQYGRVTAVANGSLSSLISLSPNPSGTFALASGGSSITVNSNGLVTNVTPATTNSGLVGSYILPTVTVNQFGNITAIAPATTNSALVGSYTSANITVDAYGRITAVANGTSGSGSGVTSVGILGGTGVTVTGTSPITSTGTLTVSLANSGVTAGPYTLANITVDALGRITAASNGTITSASLPTVGTPGIYTMPFITVDAYGRVIAASNGSLPTVGTPGVYTMSANGSSLTVDSYGRITAVTEISGNSALVGSYILPTVTLNQYGDITAITASTPNSGLVGSYTYANITVDGYGRITAAANGTAPTLPSIISPGTFSLATVTVNANGLVTAISNGTLPTITTAGSYTNANITVDATGRVTAASNGSGGSGGGLPTTGDVTVVSGSNKLTSIQGNTISAASPTDLQIIAYNGLTHQYENMTLTGVVANRQTGDYGAGVGHVSAGYMYAMFTQAPGNMAIATPNTSTATGARSVKVVAYQNMSNPSAGTTWTTTLDDTTYPNMKLTGDTVSNANAYLDNANNRSYWEGLAAWTNMVYVVFGYRASGDPAATQAVCGFTVVGLSPTDGSVQWSYNIGPYDGTHWLDFVRGAAADATGMYLQTYRNIYKISPTGTLLWTYALKQSAFTTSITFSTGSGSTSVSNFYPCKTSMILDYSGGMYLREYGSVTKLDVSNGGQIWTDLISTFTNGTTSYDPLCIYSNKWLYSFPGISCFNGLVGTVYYTYGTTSEFGIVVINPANGSGQIMLDTHTLGSANGGLQTFQGCVIGNSIIFGLGTAGGINYTIGSTTLSYVSDSIPNPSTSYTCVSPVTYDGYIWFYNNYATGAGLITKIDQNTLATAQSWSIPAISGYFFRAFAAGPTS